MLKRTILVLAFYLGLGMTAMAGTEPQTRAALKYNFTIDLTNVQNDRVQVTLKAPLIEKNEVVYIMPKIVPGTYSVSDFGKFVSSFKAYAKNGDTLAVEKMDVNRWKISNANRLDKITYWVDDSFDTPKREDVLFEPGGTNIEEGKNFLLNTFGFIGYFGGMKQLPYQLNINKPKGFYGSTPLKATATSDSLDTFELPNYVDLADSPLMYNRPDTTVLNLGETEVLVSVYSPSGRVTSPPIASTVKSILEAQRSYLGGTLPVDKYAFLIYVPERVGKSGSFGALEHSYSSVYFLPEMPEAQFSSTIRDVAAHEFFHIVTPLNIHSEEIGNFDFINPKMSKHLWLYEGVTEYFASHVQAYEGLYDTDTFLEKLREYILTSKAYYNDTLPFTQMSAGVLDKYEKEYGNVYQKGALIGLVLDIKLRELSQGKYGLRNLMLDLSKTYGKQNAFKDEELFDKITEMTYPEIREFFAKHVEGSEPLPLEATFQSVGITYEPVATREIVSYGGFAPGFDEETGKIKVADTADMDAFGRKIGFKTGDLLLKLNGNEITPQNIRELLSDTLQSIKAGEKVSFVVGRKNDSGEMKEKKLKGKATVIRRQQQHVLKVNPAATPQQIETRNAWLGKNAKP